MTAKPAYLEFAPPPPQGTGRSLGLALLIHFLLMLALTAGIQWKQDNSLSVEAELWADIPMAAAPKLVEVEPPPPPPPADGTTVVTDPLDATLTVGSAWDPCID